MTWKLVTGPSSEPLTLAEVKNHLKIDSDTTDDTLVTALIVAAREQAEKATRRQLMPATWELQMDGFPPYENLGQYVASINGTLCEYWREIRLSNSPVQSITSIIYDDSNGNPVTWDAANYITDVVSEPARITLAPSSAWPIPVFRANSVRIRYVAGYANAAAVPQGIKQAMLLMIGSWYDNRDDSMKRYPSAVDALLSSYKVFTF